ncbi:hypothetical protein BGZ68_010456 [Mortierella alpina]|nr:hypothetical protein BGZ68_010456 [Mortierella alpina]
MLGPQTKGKGQPLSRPVRGPRRLSAASMIGPPRRTAPLGNVGNQGAPTLQHKPNYRHVSPGAIYRSVHEGLEADNSVSEIRDNNNADDKDWRVVTHRRAGSVMVTGANHASKPSMSIQDVRSLASGKNAALAKSRTKSPTPGSGPTIPKDTGETTTNPKDIHPGEKIFKPMVTCRYPETDWKDGETFPTFLPMFCFPAELTFKLSDERPPTTYHSFVLTQEVGGRSYAMCVTFYERPPQRMLRQFEDLCNKWTHSHMSESEIEYARAIKDKISKEKSTLRSLQLRLREERTMGRRSKQAQLKREITDSEEKLSLLEDQMKPWSDRFVDIEDAWIPRCVGIVSAVPYHYLMRDWLLAVVVACSGGVEHPGMSLNSLRLESYVKNLIHEVSLPPLGRLEVGITINNRVLYASRPALNSVPIVKNFSLFPLFRCLTAEDIVTVIEVILSEGKVIFLSSYLAMLTLASESFLYLLFPLYWQGVYIPILPSSLMTCLQAPVPYIIGVERRCCDSEFPPEEACVVDLDKGTINVQLAPTPLPPRQRRKLIQSLEQYAPTSAIKRSAAVHNPMLGPPAYVKEAFPHSRLTLFCGVSRAPRWSKRVESTLTRPLPAVPNGSTNGHLATDQNGTPIPNSPALVNRAGSMLDGFPAMTGSQRNQRASDVKAAVGGMTRSASDDILDKSAELDSKDSKQTQESLSRSNSTQEPPHNNTPESPRANGRKGMSPTKARSAIFDSHKKLENGFGHANGGMHPGINRHNSSSSHSTHMAVASSGYEGPGLTHRASFTSIDSTTSSMFSRSAMTSNTMISINGPPSSTTSSPEDDGSVVGLGDPGRSAPTTIEGHVLSPVATPVPLPLLTCRCGICSRGLAAYNEVYRCEGCALYVHSGCLDELLYPCVPRGFDESGVCWSILQMWAGLMKGYRTGIIAGAGAQQHLQSPSAHHHQQHQVLYQNHSTRVYGHVRQLSNAGSENEREGKDRLSWASFSRWAGRNSGSNGVSNGNAKGSFSSQNRASTNVEQIHLQQSTALSQRSQVITQPLVRGRSGTEGSTHSDTVSFHRDLFMKGVDKEARPFMSVFTESQAFSQFVQDRMDRSPTDPEIRFFDEVIKAKINRSRFRIGKEETKFLDDPSYGVQGTKKAVPPSGDIQIHDSDSRRFPTSLDPAYM